VKKFIIKILNHHCVRPQKNLQKRLVRTCHTQQPKIIWTIIKKHKINSFRYNIIKLKQYSHLVKRGVCYQATQNLYLLSAFLLEANPANLHLFWPPLNSFQVSFLRFWLECAQRGCQDVAPFYSDCKNLLLSVPSHHIRHYFCFKTV
jgi:hypothetical protein